MSVKSSLIVCCVALSSRVFERNRAIVQSVCTLEDLTLNTIQISTVC